MCEFVYIDSDCLNFSYGWVCLVEYWGNVFWVGVDGEDWIIYESRDEVRKGGGMYCSLLEL